MHGAGMPGNNAVRPPSRCGHAPCAHFVEHGLGRRARVRDGLEL
jgi:hypothetical protein